MCCKVISLKNTEEFVNYNLLELFWYLAPFLGTFVVLFLVFLILRFLSVAPLVLHLEVCTLRFVLWGLNLEVCTLRYVTWGLNLEVCTFKFAPEICTFRFTPSYLHLCTWRFALAGFHLQVCTQRFAPRGLHQEVCTKRFVPKGLHLQVCTNMFAPAGLDQYLCTLRFAPFGCAPLVLKTSGTLELHLQFLHSVFLDSCDSLF